MSRNLLTILTLRCFVDGTCHAVLEVDTEGWYRSSGIVNFMMRWIYQKKVAGRIVLTNMVPGA